MRSFTIALLFLLQILTNSCRFKDVGQYNVTIKQYAGGTGVTIIYSIDTAGIQVKTNCDLANCKERIVYNGTFTREQSDRFYNSLKALNLDTLQKEYEPAGVVYDRLYTLIKINGHGLPDKSIAIENQKLPATDSLYKTIDRLIVKKYRFESWGQD
jgi:hypothetical protein